MKARGVDITFLNVTIKVKFSIHRNLHIQVLLLLSRVLSLSLTSNENMLYCA